MSDYEKRKNAQEWVAQKIKESSGGRISSEEAHKESARIARDTDAKAKPNPNRKRK